MLRAGDIGYLSKLTAVGGVMFLQTPGDYHYSWHNAPQRQFIVNLDTDVEVEVRPALPACIILLFEGTPPEPGGMAPPMNCWHFMLPA